MLELYPADHLSFVPSLITALLCLLGPIAAWIVIRRRQSSLRSQQNAELRRFSEPLPALAPGLCVLKGPIEYAQGSAKAVVQEIVQKGVTLELNPDDRHEDKSHTWTEIERVTHAEPFYVADMRGQRVRVEPGDDVILRGIPESPFGVHKHTRMLVLELAPGNEVYVSGELCEAHDPEAKPSDYRSAARGFVLRPAAGQPLYVGTMEPSSRFATPLRYYRAVTYFALFCALVFAVLLSPFVVSLVMGETVSGKVALKRERFVEVTYGSRNVWDYFDAEDANQIREGRRMAVRLAPRWAISQIAPMPSLSSWFVAGMLGSWLILALLVRYRPKTKRENHKSSGPGPLPNALHVYPLAIREPARTGDSRYRRAQ